LAIVEDIATLIFGQLVDGLTGGRSSQLPFVLFGLTCTFLIIRRAGGGVVALIYFACIPFLNWSFGVIESLCLVTPSSGDPGRVMFDACLYSSSNYFPRGLTIHPLVLVTGLVFVLRDFVQRRIGQKVLIVMALGIAWAFYYAWPLIALASGLAFAISELADWALYTFSRYRLSTRILLSSAVAAPIDTTIFLYGADLAVQMELGSPPGTLFHWANLVVFIAGKMVGALIVSDAVRRREKIGVIDPAAT